MQRDCCEGLLCVTGEWQYTTDSTCLSPRSKDIDDQNLSMEKRIIFIQKCYQRVEKHNKSAEDVRKLVKKHDNVFSKLVTRLERKYDIKCEISGETEVENSQDL